MNKELVTKSHRMMKARDGMLTHQHKFLGLAVSKFDPHKDEFDNISISYKEYCALSGENFENKHYKRFYNTARKALKRWIYIPQENGIDFDEWPLVEHISGRKGTINLKFNPQLKEHFIQIKEKFASIGLDLYFQFKRDYSTGFYELLKTREKQAGRDRVFFVDITIEDIRLKFKLGDKYKLYKNLKNRVILSALNEINDLTTYKFLRLEETGRPVEKIRIWAKIGAPKPVVKVVSEPKQESLTDNLELEEAKVKWSHKAIMELLKSKPTFVSNELYIISNCHIVAKKINEKWKVISLVDEKYKTLKPLKNASNKQETVIFEAVRKGSINKEEAEKVLVAEKGTIQKFVGWVMGKGNKPEL